MSLLRTLIILLLIYFVFRYILRKVFLKSSLPPQPRMDEGEREQLHSCPTCGTYNAATVAFRANGGYYCNRECFNRRESKK